MKVYSGKSLKALIIEDDPVSSRLLRDMLSKSSRDTFKVKFADSLAAAFRFLDKSHFDIILLDLNLPDSSCLSTLIKTNEKYPQVAIVVITGADDEVLGLKAVAGGAQDYLVKGKYDIHLLHKSIRYAIERKQAEKRLQAAYTKLKETQTQLIQAEKLEAVGRMASGVAHEVRNPLAIILQGINYLERKHLLQEDVSGILEKMKHNVRRADVIIRSLIDFSRMARLDLKPLDVKSIIQDSLFLAPHDFKTDNIKVVRKIKKDLPKLLADKGKMEQLFINIFLNAVQAMPDGGTLFIRAYTMQMKKSKDKILGGDRSRFDSGEAAVVVEIEDTGCGISARNIEKIFDPFFTTKGPRDGAGLGLTVSRNIVEMHRGFIGVESKEGKGTKVTLILKIAGER